MFIYVYICRYVPCIPVDNQGTGAHVHVRTRVLGAGA